ncbi:META domain-containing protein [Pseudoalteromonas sp. T1lg23B]|uniref:META domain-containing protein n=1 Tax=Pseudoalteromonas sp. T1lg23B TaxID=2077097 RepID=UPI000CF6EBAF|nr:META domain-containing protein [Pseudoalteromonas sp. T1lg23B]
MKTLTLLFATSAFLFGCTSTGKVNNTQLKHTHWQLSHVAGKALKSSQISIEFIEAMQVNGNGGCNRFFGEGQLTDSTLKVNHIGMTRKLCDEQTNKMERTFLKMLEKGVPVLLLNDTLIFKGQPELRFQVAG